MPSVHCIYSCSFQWYFEKIAYFLRCQIFMKNLSLRTTMKISTDIDFWWMLYHRQWFSIGIWTTTVYQLNYVDRLLFAQLDTIILFNTRIYHSMNWSNTHRNHWTDQYYTFHYNESALQPFFLVNKGSIEKRIVSKSTNLAAA